MSPAPARLPAVFFGHGNPMFALQENDYTRAWRQLGARLPRPRAILMISAHWYIGGTAVTAMEHPRTIHDFGGFPQALFDVRYPAPGDPALASRVAELLAPLAVGMDHDWGLDHGAWSVLCKAYPEADIPVIQLSIDARQPAAFHFALGRRLAPLRDEGILIAASGNVVHNLRTMVWGEALAFDWATRFNVLVRRCLEQRDFAPLIDYAGAGADARLAVPTPEHYLPLLYVLGAHQEGEPVTIPVDGMDGGSISMMSVMVGEPAMPEH